MAELGVIASIVGIAGIGIKLSKTLYQVGHRHVSASHNINRIATNVSLFASMLKHVGTVLDDSHSLHSPEAVETVEQIVKECESVFQEIADLVVTAKNKGEMTKEPPLANGSKRRMSIMARAKWYFEGPKAEHLLSQLEYLKTTLSVLLQTLNLAALNAKVKETLGESERPPEIVQQEKLHIETLVVAQQLSVHVMQETQSKLDAEDTRPTSPATDYVLDKDHPKLLTQDSTSSLQMVRLNSHDIQFLDRKPSLQSEDGVALEPSISRSESFIEDLLARWTVPPEEKFRKEAAMAQSVVEPEGTKAHIPDVESGQQEIEARPDSHASPVPDVQVKPPSLAPSSPPRSAPPRNVSSPRSDTATLARREHLNARTGSVASYQPSEVSSNPSRVISPRLALERSMTNPEGDGMPMLNTFHDQHSLQMQVPLHRFVSPNPGLGPPMRPREASYQSSALAPYMAGAAAASGNKHLTPNWSNYRQPYVSDDDSMSLSDSDDSPPASQLGKVSSRARRESNTSNASRTPRRHRRSSLHDSGHGDDVGDGLDIPWRIRISPTKYFDFRDNEMVGPRTPYLPTESRSWIYSHESAHTEISKQWVCEEALIEMRYPRNEIRSAQESPGIAGDEGGWRILQPLKFHEIDALVNRTIQYVEQAKTNPRQQSGPAPYLRPMPQTLSQAQQPIPMPAMPPMATRHMSYNNSLPPLHPPQAPLPSRGVFAPQAMSPRDVAEPSPRDRHVREPRDRDHDLEYAKERKRDRHRRREREREKERDKADKERKEKDKHKGSGMAGTLAKVGTLAVLLEGLDGAF